jgi:hypothetical protein
MSVSFNAAAYGQGLDERHTIASSSLSAPLTPPVDILQDRNSKARVAKHIYRRALQKQNLQHFHLTSRSNTLNCKGCIIIFAFTPTHSF